MSLEQHPHLRPQSEILTDLHVYLIPADSWRHDLQSAMNEVVLRSVSLGFVRVNPDMKLSDLRDEMPTQLDLTQLPEAYAFLRSVGRCFAKVAKKQESRLKVKYFMPPHAASQEIFLLPASHADDDAASMADSMSLRADSMSSLRSIVLLPITSASGDAALQPALANGTKESATKNRKTPTPLQSESIRAVAASPSVGSPTTKGLSTGSNPAHPPPSPSLPQPQARDAQGVEPAGVQRGGDGGRSSRSLRSGKSTVSAPTVPAAPAAAATTADADAAAATGESVGGSRVSDLPNDSDATNPRGSTTSERNDGGDVAGSLQQVPLDVALATRQLTAARQARLDAERRRAEVIKRVKALQAKTDNRRTQAKEMWKRKYFDEKQKTPSLEESCDSLKVLLTAVRQKSVQRAGGGSRPLLNNGHAGTTPEQQQHQQSVDERRAAVLKLEYEIQDLQQQVERASMQVTADLKLRTQAETELRVLRAELAQYKLSAHGTGLD